MSIWFEGSNDIDCTLERVVQSLGDLGAHHLGVIGRMPGLSAVEVVEQGEDFVTLRTNEGVMTRTGISKRVEPDRVVLQLDEDYQAGRLVTTKAHFHHEFTARGEAVEHRIVISSVEAPGFLGFFYRKLGSSSIGNAFLRSTKDFLESTNKAGST